MKAKVKKFVETADPSAAALLQSKMDALSQRFSNACDKHKQKVSQLEQLKEKVEQFDEVAGKFQQFVVKCSQELHETDGPGKTFNELSELMKVNTHTSSYIHKRHQELDFILQNGLLLLFHCRILKLRWLNMPVIWRSCRLCPRSCLK